MRIHPLQPVTGCGKTPEINNKEGAAPPKAGINNRTDVYEPSSKEKVATYDKSLKKTDHTSIARLKEDSEKAYESLRRIVIELLERQGLSADRLKEAGMKSVDVDETARAEAARLIADDGPLGAEAVSNRIVDFAIALSGGDKAKLGELKGAIKEGFRQVKEMLGGLPEVSMRTYDLIMEKLDKHFE